jgi:hypothetical protein
MSVGMGISNIKRRKGPYGSRSDSVCGFFISGDRAVSWSPRSYLEQVINDAMATADNRHVLRHSGIIKTRQELERKDCFLLENKRFYVVLLPGHIYLINLLLNK